MRAMWVLASRIAPRHRCPECGTLHDEQSREWHLVELPQIMKRRRGEFALQAIVAGFILFLGQFTGVWRYIIVPFCVFWLATSLFWAVGPRRWRDPWAEHWLVERLFLFGWTRKARSVAIVAEGIVIRFGRKRTWLAWHQIKEAPATGILVNLHYQAAKISEQLPLGDYDRLLFESETEAEEFTKRLGDARRQDPECRE